MQDLSHYEAVCAEIVRLLREERERRDLSRYAVSKSCGVSQSMLSLVERGHRNPTMELMLRVADGIGADLPKIIRQAQAGISKKNVPAKKKVVRQSKPKG